MDRFTEHFQRLAGAAREVAAARGLARIEAEGVLVIDVSRSMFPAYRARLVQPLVTELLALSLTFDDDGVIPAYAFGDRCRHLGDLRVADFAGYVDREVIRTGADYQRGCNYAPVIHDVCRYYFPEDWDQPALVESVGRLRRRERVVYPMLSAPRAHPVFAMFVTGGDCEDLDATADAIRRSSRLPIFWQFIGLSGPGSRSEFRFLRQLDRLGNTYVDNCGFFEAGEGLGARELFDGLLNELPDYLCLPAVQAMLRPPEEGGRVTHGERRVESADVPDVDVAAIVRQREAEAKARARAKREAARQEAEREKRAKLEQHTDIDALRAKLKEVEWVESTVSGASAAPRAAAPVKHEPTEGTGVRRARRARPSEESAGSPAPRERTVDDSKTAIRQRIMRLKERLAGLDDDDDATLPGAARSAEPPPNDEDDDATMPSLTRRELEARRRRR